MTNSLSFQQFDQALRNAGSYFGAAEVHGLQVGLICGATVDENFHWEQILWQELDCLTISAEIMANLQQLYAQTAYHLYSIDANFTLFLPTEDATLMTKTQALANWCRGFICGLGAAGIQDDAIYSILAKEAIDNLSDLAHLEITEGDIFDGQDRIFTELVEYIRLAVKTVQLELQAGVATEYLVH